MDGTERDERIAELEQRLDRRRTGGLRLPVALLAMGVSLFFLWSYRLDAQYFFSPREPVTLGAEGDYHFDRLVSNRYVQVHGVPTLRGAYGRVNGQTTVLVGLQDTPILVLRPALATEQWMPGSTPPAPDQRTLAVRGRLLAQEDARRRYQDAFAKLGPRDHVAPRDGKLWLLVQGERPGGDYTDLLVPALLVAFFLWNARVAYLAFRNG